MTAVSTFPRRLREARKRAGLSQHEVARALGIDRATVSKYERGKRTPPPVTCAMLEALLGTRLPHTHEDAL